MRVSACQQDATDGCLPLTAPACAALQRQLARCSYRWCRLTPLRAVPGRWASGVHLRLAAAPGLECNATRAGQWPLAGGSSGAGEWPKPRAAKASLLAALTMP